MIFPCHTLVSCFNNVDIYFLLGLLNSKVIKFYWLQKFADNRKQFLKIKGGYLEKIPFQRNEQIEERIKLLTQKIVESIEKSDDVLQNELNHSCYELYGLTDEEIAVVEATIK